MKKLYTLLLLVVTSMSFGQAAFTFSGTVGTAVNTIGWQTHSGTTPGQIVLVAGSLNYPGLTSQGNKTQIVSANSEDINLSGFTPITTAAYYSGLISLPDVTGLGANTSTGNYFLMTGVTAGLALPNGPGVTAFNGRIYIRLGSAQNTFNLGILNGPGGTAAPTFTGDLAIATTHFIVVKFNIATNTASLWVNPAIGSAEGAATVTNVTGTTAAPASIASLCIRQSSPTTGNIEIDELRISDNWAYVTSGILGTNQNTIAGFSISPNPVNNNGVFYITTAANAERKVTMFDVLGKQVLNVTTSDSAINVSGLNSGVYMVQVTEEGNTETKKLVIR
jgi:Secretion system C-terminal sorting domain